MLDTGAPTAIRNAEILSTELEGFELTFVGHSAGGGEMDRLGKIVIIVLKIIAFLFCFLIIKSIFGLFYWRMTHLSAEDLAWVKTIEQKTSHRMFVSDTASNEIILKGSGHSK